MICRLLMIFHLISPLALNWPGLLRGIALSDPIGWLSILSSWYDRLLSLAATEFMSVVLDKSLGFKMSLLRSGFRSQRFASTILLLVRTKLVLILL